MRSAATGFWLALQTWALQTKPGAHSLFFTHWLAHSAGPPHTNGEQETCGRGAQSPFSLQASPGCRMSLAHFPARPQGVPAGRFFSAHFLDASSQALSRQEEAPEHWRGAPPTHRPPWQRSPSVQNLPSSQMVPLGFGVEAQALADSLHAPSEQAVLKAEQSRGAPLHSPRSQKSPVVQNLPSSQAAPSALGLVSQLRALSLHTPSPHTLEKIEQSRGEPPQEPSVLQASLTVQNTPSSQAVPAAFGAASQASFASLQAPAVQAPFRPLQSLAGPGLQAPFSHLSSPVQ
ncbi:MAG: hypothetical protein GMKNLPBB_02887 [Myxococcota bacterium]|nr:hypothetical protein [Myxococcota bacterium]